MTIKYLKKSPKTSSTDDLKTREIVQNLLNELEKSREKGCKERDSPECSLTSFLSGENC